MHRLTDILEDLAEADTVAGQLREMKEVDPDDPIVPVNLYAVLRRRTDLERQLGSLLAKKQIDIVRYRVELFDGSDPPAAAVARSVVLFQSLVTAVFDAVRSEPKRLYQPSPENVRISALSFAHSPIAGGPIHFTIPNDRLLVLESDLDLTFGLVFEVLMARAKTLIRDIAGRAGIASVAAAHAWAENAVQHGLTTTIAWRKKNDERRSETLTHAEALLFKTSIEAVVDDSVETMQRDCELMSVDEAAGTFKLGLPDKSTIAGTLTDGFPRGGNWTMRHWYRADLLRASRIRYATGEETVRWSLRGLAPQE